MIGETDGSCLATPASPVPTVCAPTSGSGHGTRAADDAERLARLAEDRDTARTEGERLQDEAQRLRAELDARAAEAERLGHQVAELEVVRAGCERLEAERQQTSSEAEQ